MHLKRSHTLASALMISTVFSPLSQATQQTALAHYGIHLDKQGAAKVYSNPTLVMKLATQGAPKGLQEDLDGFMTVHDANPSTTPIAQIDAQHTAVRKLKERGIDMPTPQDALKFNSKADVVRAYNEVVKPSGHVISPMEYLQAHEASLPGTDPLDVVQHHVGVKALATMGVNAPNPQETKASTHFAKLMLLDQMPDLLGAAIYLQNNTDGTLAANIDEPSLPQMRGTKFIVDAGVIGLNDRQINTIATLVGINGDLTPEEVRETLRLANLRVNFIPDRYQIREGIRQMGFGIGARSIEQIDEGLRQMKLDIVDPNPDLITEGLRLATVGLANSSKNDLTAAVTLQNPGGAPIIRDPSVPQVSAMKYLMNKLKLAKPDADWVNAVVKLRNPAGLIEIKEPKVKHILGLLRLDQLGDHNPTKARLLAAAHLVNPDGLNENPVDFKRIDYIVRLQSADVGIDEPTLDEVNAAQYLMDPGYGIRPILIPLPTRGEIRATVYWRKSLADGGLGDLNPTVENIRAVAHLQKPVPDGGLGMAEPTMPQITAAKHLLTLMVNPFSPEDLTAVMDLQAGHGDVVARPLPALEYIKAAKCLLGHGKAGIYTLKDLEVTKYLQTNPGNALGAAAIETPEWNQIQGTAYLRGVIPGLNIIRPSLAQVNGVVHAQTVLGAQDPAYLTPTEPQLNAIVHLQGPLVNKLSPSIKEVRATVLLQTPGPRGFGGYGLAGAILDPNPSARRIAATVELQDWQRPAAHAGVHPARPTLAQIDAVAKADGHKNRMEAIAWAIQEGFGGRPVGTIPTVLGHVIEEKDGSHYFRLVTIEDNAAALMGLHPLPASLELVRDRLLDRADGEHKLPGTTKFKVANANIAGLNRLIDGKLPPHDFIVGIGLTPDPLNLGGVIITSQGNRPD